MRTGVGSVRGVRGAGVCAVRECAGCARCGSVRGVRGADRAQGKLLLATAEQAVDQHRVEVQRLRAVD